VLFGVGIVVCFLYSLWQMPPYVAAARHLHSAHRALEAGDYTVAIRLYDQTLALVPSRVAKVERTEAMLSDDDKTNDQLALLRLGGVYVSDDEKAAIRPLVPPEYRQLFLNIP
jgi:hypothetical protein